MAKKVKPGTIDEVVAKAGAEAFGVAVVEKLTPEQADIANSRESLKHPLAEGQGFFESPEGYIVVAQSDRDRVWCQKAAGGKGMYINPKR